MSPEDRGRGNFCRWFPPLRILWTDLHPTSIESTGRCAAVYLCGGGEGLEGRGHVDAAAVGLGQGADVEDPTADAPRVEQLAGLGVGELLGHGAHARQHLVRRGQRQAQQVGPAGWRWKRGEGVRCGGGGIDT